MSEASKFFKDLVEDQLLKLNTAMPCRVISYDVAGRLAKVQPLFMRKERGQEPRPLPPIEDVPVVFQRVRIDGEVKELEPVIQTGDVVFVVFAQRALDNVMSGRVAYPGIRRRHALTDAVIVGIM